MLAPQSHAIQTIDPSTPPSRSPQRRLLGEREHRDRLHRPAPLGQHADESRDLLTGLADARGRLDDQRLVERGADALALGVVDEGVMASWRYASVTGAEAIVRSRPGARGGAGRAAN
jgi:hypothetical protein